MTARITERKKRGGERSKGERWRRSSPLAYASMGVQGREEKKERRGCACAPLLTLLLAIEFPSREREREQSESEKQKERGGERRKKEKIFSPSRVHACACEET